MNKRLIVAIALIIVIGLALAIVAITQIPSPVQNQVKALLNDTGATYEFIDCSGGWFSRECHSEIKISKAELNKLIEEFALASPLPYFDDQTRLILVDGARGPCASELRTKYSKAFGIQQWNPSRHGFASVIIFFNQENNRACIFLSIAYG